jgi:hypothetical protein
MIAAWRIRICALQHLDVVIARRQIKRRPIAWAAEEPSVMTV